MKKSDTIYVITMKHRGNPVTHPVSWRATRKEAKGYIAEQKRLDKDIPGSACYVYAIRRITK